MGQPLDDQMQEEPIVLGRQPGVGRWIEQGRQLGLEALEQAQHQWLLAVEVVVQVARADPHFIGHLHGRNVGLAFLVEQLQGTFKDPVAGLHPVFLGRSDRSPRLWGSRGR